VYTSSMKFCGAMELCGIGYPQGEPMDYEWPAIEEQVKAQKAGLLISICREHKPQEAQLMRDRGFAPVYKFTNPRTGNVGVLWIKDYTGAGGPVTKLPERIDVGPPAVLPARARMVAPQANLLDALSNPRYTTGVDTVSSPESDGNEEAPF